jgi:hypothetical protein
MDKLPQPKILIVQQTGAALVVSLMLLVILTMLGISAMESTKLETKMATNTAEVNRALQMAEYGVSRVHNELRELVFNAQPTEISSVDLDGADANGFLELKDDNGEVERIYRYKYNTVQGPFPGRDVGSLRLFHFFTTVEGYSGSEPDSPKVKLKIGWTKMGPQVE